MVQPGAPFLFGKLPAHGDFVSRGLSDASRQAWDDWASSAIERLRGLGDDFAAIHDTVAPWRFLAGPSGLGDGWRIGALAPSIDSAGRRFVLVLGFHGIEPSLAVGAGQGLAADVEAVLYRALVERLTADEVIGVLAGKDPEREEACNIALALGARPSAPGAWWSPGSGHPPITAASPPTELFCLEPLALSENAA